MINNINVREYSKADKPAIINLLSYLLKGFTESERMDLFEWRYERNPYQNKPLMLLAFSENILVGFRAYLIQYFCISGIKITVISPADTIIHPEYRRCGLTSMLNKRSLDLLYSEFPDDSVLLNTTTSKYAMPTYLKNDWYPCSNRDKVYAYRPSILNFIRLLFKNKAARQDEFIRRSFAISEFVFEVSNEKNTSKMIEFIQKNRDTARFSNLRDESFFKWRYSYEPDKYIYCICNLDKTIVGYSILKKVSRYQFSVEEYLAIDSKTMKVMFEALQRKLKIPILRTIIFSNRDKQEMKSCKFLVESSLYIKFFKKKRFPVLVRPLRPNLSENDFFVQGTDIRNIENWQLYQSDRH